MSPFQASHLSKWNQPLPVSAPSLTPLALLSISDVWRCASENFFVPEYDWQKPRCARLHQEVGISAQFLPPSLTLQSNMCIFTGWGRATWRDTVYSDRVEGLHGLMPICLFVYLGSQGEKGKWQLWPGFWWIYVHAQAGLDCVSKFQHANYNID